MSKKEEERIVLFAKTPLESFCAFLFVVVVVVEVVAEFNFYRINKI